MHSGTMNIPASVVKGGGGKGAPHKAGLLSVEDCAHLMGFKSLFPKLRFFK